MPHAASIAAIGALGFAATKIDDGFSDWLNEKGVLVRVSICASHSVHCHSSVPSQARIQGSASGLWRHANRGEARACVAGLQILDSEVRRSATRRFLSLQTQDSSNWAGFEEELKPATYFWNPEPSAAGGRAGTVKKTGTKVRQLRRAQ